MGAYRGKGLKGHNGNPVTHEALPGSESRGLGVFPWALA